MPSPEYGPGPSSYLAELEARPGREVLGYKNGSTMDVFRQPPPDLKIGALLDGIDHEAGSAYLQSTDSAGRVYRTYMDPGALISEVYGPNVIHLVKPVREQLRGASKDLTVADLDGFLPGHTIDVVGWPSKTGSVAREQDGESAPTAIGARELAKAREALEL